MREFIFALLGLCLSALPKLPKLPNGFYKATEGKMIIFPSLLNHGVEPNLSDEERVCISFNISMTYLTSV
nr:putative 2OG-Fe(II) oxygenase [Pseudanabaena sp. FACHB-1998]